MNGTKWAHTRLKVLGFVADVGRQAAESKKEEFRKYLEKSGVIDALTKVLVALYEEPEKPPNALDFIKQYLGAPSSKEIEDMRTENEDVKRQNEALKEEIENLGKKLKEAKLTEQAPAQ